MRYIDKLICNSKKIKFKNNNKKIVFNSTLDCGRKVKVKFKYSFRLMDCGLVMGLDVHVDKFLVETITFIVGGEDSGGLMPENKSTILDSYSRLKDNFDKGKNKEKEKLLISLIYPNR